MKRADSLFPETYTLGTHPGDQPGTLPGQPAPPALTIVLFAGLGGADQGLKTSLGRAPDYAVNHWPAALSVNRVNHPDSVHLIADILEVDPREVVRGRPVDVLWASPDCRSFSGASGGAITSPGLRMLPWKIPWWVNEARPRFLLGENVKSMRTTWGGLVAQRKAGKIVYKNGQMVMTNTRRPSKRNKRWKDFVQSIERLGYTFESRVMNAADYGAPTRRERLLFAASRTGEPFPWPAQTHARPDDPRVVRGELLPWIPAGPLLDHDLPAESLFSRDSGKPIEAKTLARVAHSVMAELLESAAPYLFRDAPDHLSVSPQEAAACTSLRGGFISIYHGSKKNKDTGEITGVARHTRLSEPVVTIDTSNRLSLIGLRLVRLGSHPGDLTALERQYPHAHLVYDLLLEHFGPDRLAPYADPERRLIFCNVGGQRFCLPQITSRFLNARELARCQGFPDDYEVERGHDGRRISDADTKRMLGNSVPPAFSHALGLAIRPLLEQAPTHLNLPSWLQERRERRGQDVQAAD